MTLSEIGIIIGKKLEFRLVNAGRTIQVNFLETESKLAGDSGMIKGTYGSGATRQKALEDYAAQLSGMWLVIDCHTDEDRRDFQLPPTITADKEGTE